MLPNCPCSVSPPRRVNSIAVFLSHERSWIRIYEKILTPLTQDPYPNPYVIKHLSDLTSDWAGYIYKVLCSAPVFVYLNYHDLYESVISRIIGIIKRKIACVHELFWQPWYNNTNLSLNIITHSKEMCGGRTLEYKYTSQFMNMICLDERWR